MTGLLPTVPRRVCALCAAEADGLHKTLAGRRWLCAACARGAALDEPASEVSGVSDVPAADTVRRVDAALRAAIVVVRVVVYLGLVVLSMTTEVGSQLVAGVLAADAATWVVGAALDLRHHRPALGIELLLYIGVSSWLAAQGHLSLPPDAEGRAVAALGFMGVLSVKGGVLAWRWLHGERG